MLKKSRFFMPSNISILRFLLLIAFTLNSAVLHASEPSSFDFTANQSGLLLHVTHKDPLLTWAVNDFADNVGRRAGRSIEVTEQYVESGAGILVTVDPFHPRLKALENTPHGQWEGFAVFVSGETLHVVGADIRGAVYGLMTIAEKVGISPWHWWADVEVAAGAVDKASLILTGLPMLESPAVKYRGVFLNDEDWGLLPWAAKTFEPETGNIGPRTYEKIFQLLLRLKANTIWPAMHPGTKAFFTVPGNKAMAQRYQIHVGTSHAEPMMRNNVYEWQTTQRGQFDYVNNSQQVLEYWQSRVEELGDVPDLPLFTLGMRGIHDSHMQGTSSIEESVAVLQQVIQKQRQLLREVYGDKRAIKQVFTPYKEVLALYNAGLAVPEEVTLVWPDDNYGYIRRRSNPQEQLRTGGSGVYYHLSYWGRPHDYLWLSSTHPALIQVEMARAYADGAKQLWIANVGDIKPIEYNTEWFLELGWSGPELDVNNARSFLQQQFARDFGPALAEPLADLMLTYYHLAFIRRPEFMGWSQTEPTTPTSLTSWSESFIHNRLRAYQRLEDSMRALARQVPAQLQSAWYQLVAYPIEGAAAMNRKWLYRQLASTTVKPDVRESYRAKAVQAHRHIQQLTDLYNSQNNGKWAAMMDASPRRLPVFDSPSLINEGVVSTSGYQEPVVLASADTWAPKGAQWRAIPELGYSRHALTVFPLATRSFESKQPTVSYAFDLPVSGDVNIEIATLPTHANQFDHQLKVLLNNKQVEQIALNSRGRSEAWKQGVLANRRVNRLHLSSLSAGHHVLTLAVNQTGIVIDEVTMTQAGKTAEK